jgi:predicted nucleotidyltransferase
MDGKPMPKIEELLSRAQQDTDVLAVLLFGSTARREQSPTSDVDICLIVNPQVQTFEPGALSRKRIEYLKDFSFDIQVFQQLPLYIQVRVLKEGRVLFARDEDRLYELAFRTARAFEDFKHVYYGYLKGVASSGPQPDTPKD